ncbi:MAG: HTH-type transcriptional regulatory protein GabR [Candidatus Erwinia impunctatus]|nr:HTH-type transcriptional regulatory protein GabR [Culicoides impunctatus]
MSSTIPALITLFAQQDARSLKDRVAATLRVLIVSRRLPDKTKLPSSRILAKDLSVSRITVEAAYTQLESEGYLQRYPGKGTFVISTETKSAQPPTTANWPFSTDPSLSDRGKTLFHHPFSHDPLFSCAFAAGSPDLQAFLHRQWQRLVNQRLQQAPEKMMGYGEIQGLQTLRESIARYLALSRGVKCHADQILVMTSSQQAIHLLAIMLCDPATPVMVEEPGYPGARSALLSAGASLSGLSVDQEGAMLPDSALAPRLVYLPPSHHYPLGVMMSQQRRQQWLEYASQHQCWVVEDDYDSEFYYQTQPLPALQSRDSGGRVIYLGTFSKVLYPSLRLAYMVVPEPLVGPLMVARQIADGHPSQLMQAVTADFINQGYFQAHLRLMRQLYAYRRSLLVNQLQQKVGEHLQIIDHQHGMQLAAVFRHKKNNENQLTLEARKHDLILPRLANSYMGHSAQQGWLLGFSALQGQAIIEGVDKLASLTFTR